MNLKTPNNVGAAKSPGMHVSLFSFVQNWLLKKKLCVFAIVYNNNTFGMNWH